MYLLDTNAWIGVFRGNQRLTQSVRENKGAIAITPHVLYELTVGALVSNDAEGGLELISRIVEESKMVPFDSLAAGFAAQIESSLRGQGKRIGPIDTLIADTALSHGLILVTHNTFEFSRVKGLQIEDWQGDST